ncbi:MAG: FG-GAP repeat protein [Planctomycetes bacterium]|nr:FG-GAP repeat protein [Planctomycetota bacterium]
MPPGYPLLLPLAALLAPALTAQTEASRLHQHLGALAGDELGRSLAVVGDLDGDGVADYAVGAPRADVYGRANAGAVDLRSGADGSLIRRHIGGSSNDWLGAALAGPGDLDGDGVPDLVAGASNASAHAGSVTAYSGADGSPVWQLDGLAPLDRFGDVIAVVADLDADGVPELLISATGADPGGRQNAGVVTLHSGASGALLRSWAGGADGDKLGYALADAGDFDGDGLGDLALGAPFADRGFANTGAVEVRSGADGSLLASFDGPSEEARFGHAIAGLGDLDGDGRPDLLVGAPNAGLAPGAAWVLSGSSGAAIYQFSDGMGNAYGQRVAAAGDLDGDGRCDFLVGVPYWDDKQALLASCGRAILFSGADGRLLWDFPGAATGDTLGDGLATGDLDGDGRHELLIGSPFADPGGASHAGKAAVWRFNHAPILVASTNSVSLSAGGEITLDLQFPPAQAGQRYALLASRSGAGPTWFKGMYVPLTVDPLFWKTRLRRYPAAFIDPAGQLDLLARARAKLSVTRGSPSWYAGSRLWIAAVSFGSGPGVDFLSRAVCIDLLN